MNIDSERDLLEVRAELKKFKKIEPKKILAILKSIKECSAINKEWIRKTKITKTLMRISLFKYPNQDDVRIMVGKFAKALVLKFKAFFPKLKTISSESAPATAPAAAPTSATQQPQQNAAKPSAPSQQKPVEQKKAESAESAKTDASQNKDLPTYKNDRRNQGLQGILKYFQKGFDESKMSASNQICVEIEKFLSSRNSTGDSFNEANYKEDVKKLCKQFIDKENSTKVKNTIYEEFQLKKIGALDCVKEILK